MFSAGGPVTPETDVKPQRALLSTGDLQRFLDSCRSFRQELRDGWLKLQVLLLVLLLPLFVTLPLLMNSVLPKLHCNFV
jgi:hypothetical protein